MSKKKKKKKRHYVALKSELTSAEYKKPAQSLSAIFRGITSNHNGDFHCLGCLHYCRTDNALKKHKRLCNNHKSCGIVMPAKDKKHSKTQLRRKIISKYILS